MAMATQCSELRSLRQTSTFVLFPPRGNLDFFAHIAGCMVVGMTALSPLYIVPSYTYFTQSISESIVLISLVQHQASVFWPTSQIYSLQNLSALIDRSLFHQIKLTVWRPNCKASRRSGMTYIHTHALVRL